MESVMTKAKPTGRHGRRSERWKRDDLDRESIGAAFLVIIGENRPKIATWRPIFATCCKWIPFKGKPLSQPLAKPEGGVLARKPPELAGISQC